MSEPMSNHEIEDVLSSIRRLVSEDLRPAPRPAEAEAKPEDKLMLTPALRVVAVPDEPAPAAPVAEPATQHAPVEEMVARLGAAVAEEEWESPFGDPEVWPGSAARSDLPAEEAAQGFVPRGRLTLKAEPEPEPEVTFADIAQMPMSAFAQTEDLLPEPDTAPVERAESRVSRRIVTPSRDEADWADAAEAAVYADLAQEAEDEVISGLYDAQAGGATFDEEVLRDLVRDLIREELSGTLGERITRNVRKLVRAEIARAMALREFE